MPGWHAQTQDWVRQGRLVVLGVAQEHHADRCRLFSQWHGFDFPILHDPINFIGATAVPIVVTIDEQGIVRAVNPKPDELEAQFLDVTFEGEPPTPAPAPSVPDVEMLRQTAQEQNSADAWRALGDALALWHSPDQVTRAIEAYTKALEIEPDDGASLFRLGVCYSMRHESDHREPGDFQRAVDRWGEALALDPGQYIWRRRIQQYGPRQDKPYPFYDWIARAQDEIAARGDEPVVVRVRPTGSELATPAKKFSVAEESTSPDPSDRVPRDVAGLVEAEVTIVPSRVRPGASTRVHVAFRPNPGQKAHWNNEAEPLRLWIEAPGGLQVDQRLLEAPQPGQTQSNELRWFDFGVHVPESSPPGPVQLTGYALYYACEDIQGTCSFLRKDLQVSVEVTP